MLRRGLGLVAFSIALVGACTDSDNHGPPPNLPLPDASTGAERGRWFGSVTLRIDNPPPPDVQQPGIKITKRHSDGWRHTIRIEEDGTRTTTSRWWLFDDQRSTLTGDCYEQYGTNLTDERGEVSTTVPGKYFSLTSDGAGGYRATEVPATVTDAEAKITSHNWMQMTTCDGGYADSNANTVPSPRMGVLIFDRIAGSFGNDPRTARGSVSYDYNGSKITVTWSLKRDKEIVAKVGGPYRVERGQRVTLDASRSRGNIDEYTWKVKPGDDCEDMGAFYLQETLSIGKEATKKDKKFEFTVICPVEIELHVKGAAGEDDDEGDVEVKARKWETKWVAPTNASWASLDADQAGTNRCAFEGGTDPVGHYLHHDGTTWRGSAFELEGPVADPDGPFDGVFYVKSHDVKVQRLEVSNPAYDPGGAIYQYNATTKNNLSIAQLLPGQIRAHESAHTELIKARLDAVRGTPNDPAQTIEGVAANSAELVEKHASFLLADSDNDLCRATRHPLVWEKLKTKYNVPARVYLPAEPDPANDTPLYQYGNEVLPCEQ